MKSGRVVALPQQSPEEVRRSFVTKLVQFCLRKGRQYPKLSVLFAIFDIFIAHEEPFVAAAVGLVMSWSTVLDPIIIFVTWIAMYADDVGAGIAAASALYTIFKNLFRRS